MVYKIPGEGISDQAIDAAKISGTLVSSFVPINGIIMWAGTIEQAEALPNWAICDGQNGTPDLRDKFVLGVGSTLNASTAAVDDEGGEATKLLGTANLPSHTHTITDQSHTHNLNYEQKQVEDTGSAHITDIRRQGGDGDGGATSYTNDNTSGFMESANTGITSTNDQGGAMGQSFDIIPPFFALAYIMRNS